FDGLLKDIKKKGIEEFKSTDNMTKGSKHVNLHISQIIDTSDGIVLKKNQQKNNQEEVNKNQFDLIIPFLFDLQGVTEPNANIRKSFSQRTSIIELFSIGVLENTGYAISSHKSFGDCYAYAKPTDKHKIDTLVNVFNKLIAYILPNQAIQELSKNITFSSGNNEDAPIYINKDSLNYNNKGSLAYNNKDLPIYLSESNEYLNETA
ncbi:2690_t:CDS:2, partial [Cetraspora pellucida]